MSVLLQALIFTAVLGVLLLFVVLDVPSVDVIDEVMDEVFGDD